MIIQNKQYSEKFIVKKRFTKNCRLITSEIICHTDGDYINDFINFHPILRNYDFKTDERNMGPTLRAGVQNNRDIYGNTPI